MFRTLLATLVLLSASAVQAWSPVSLTVLDRHTGQTLPVTSHAGEQWIAGVPGHRYSVRLTNRSNQRVLAVLSVDGVNAVSGETAAASQTGYVLEPHQSTEIAGWRKDLSQIAAFEFTALSNSYAARTGRPDNVGVIGVAVFREQPRERQYEQDIATENKQRSTVPDASAPQSSADNAGGVAKSTRAPSPAMAPPMQESLGTGHGQREYSSARRVTFDRASAQPDAVVSLRYDSRENLLAMGVIARPLPHWRRQPQAFPVGFVADP